MNKLKVLLIIILWGISSCVYTEKAGGDFVTLLSRAKGVNVSKLKLNGAFHQISEKRMHQPTGYNEGKPIGFVDTPYLDHPVFFFDDGKVLYYDALSLDSSGFRQWQQHYGTVQGSLNCWGVYQIRNDTILAIIYLNYTGMWFKRKQSRPSYFRGIIKNSDTIQGWRMIPPYPDVVQKYVMNKNVFENLTIPKDLYFKSVPVKTIIDSSKAWVNKFKKR